MCQIRDNQLSNHVANVTAAKSLDYFSSETLWSAFLLLYAIYVKRKKLFLNTFFTIVFSLRNYNWSTAGDLYITLVNPHEWHKYPHTKNWSAYIWYEFAIFVWCYTEHRLKNFFCRSSALSSYKLIVINKNILQKWNGKY